MGENNQGLIFNLQRFSTEDGPGIRTTVFLKGCPLRCVWCHNPEGLSRAQEIIWLEVRCIDCGECLERCPNAAISRKATGLSTDRVKCQVCGRCADVCVAGAREVLGRTITVEELVAEVERDRVFYETSGGGVTVGGGEPSLQAPFVDAFLQSCREKSLHTALDTCGYTSWEILENLARRSDLILFDLKLYNEDRHKKLTGVGRELIFDNLRRLAQMGKRLWVRIPIIPGYTDDEENLEGLGKILSPLETVERVELLPYHKLGEDKYRRLDKDYPLQGMQTPSREELLRCMSVLKRLPLRAAVKF